MHRIGFVFAGSRGARDGGRGLCGRARSTNSCATARKIRSSAADALPFFGGFVGGLVGFAGRRGGGGFVGVPDPVTTHRPRGTPAPAGTPRTSASAAHAPWSAPPASPR